ncbi:MAG TPA: hypothetical protein VN441_14515, partial [Syntrophomonas sp.]|nr:hypothetical protein [Syntrophomonas sp.]
ASRMPWYSVNPKSAYYLSREISAGQGGGLSNTGRIAIDDNVAMQKFNRQGIVELGLTEY